MDAERYKPRTSEHGQWEIEYTAIGIPSSARLEPSGAVVDFAGFAASQGVVGGYAIDIGCGGGRNPLYLARLGFVVTAMDFAPSQIAKSKEAVLKNGLGERVFPVQHDIRDRWPMEDRIALLGVYAFCFKHQIAKIDLEAYVLNAGAAFRRGGLLMISFAGRNDGCYSAFPAKTQAGVGLIITDPGNNISSRLYDPEEIISMFPAFCLLKTVRKTHNNTMHGATYERETHVIYFERR